ncbi:PAS sensor protein [Desulfurispirillum indicum S5]|uniref:histidine kinase n=1 Tax=Desulfurispirillum indicum (strain ATCC BAA-1389 / DSM 22839 / S5) TaxID=653733 RepID=E6W5R4_DESIS|nr:response regulator [Desulfurispirillum indicum]ADU67199.1 PAS sensor protein [Desulfurispirillum indicum S5]
MRRHFTITQRILLTTMGGFLLAGTALVVYIYITLPGSIGQLLIDEQQAKAQRIVSHIENELQMRQRALERLAPRLLDGELLKSPQQITQVLENLVMDTMEFNGGIAIFNAQGIGVGEYPRASGRIGLDISDREHMRLARSTKKPVITRPLLSRSLGVPSFFINVPLLSATGEVVGFAVGVTILGTDNFLIKIGDDHQSHSGNFFILDPANKLIVTSSLFNLAMRPLPEPGVHPVMDRVLEGVPAGFAPGLDGSDRLFASATIPQLGWVVIQTLPKDLVHSPVNRLVVQVLIFSFLILIAAWTLLAAVVARLLLPLGLAASSIDAMVDNRAAFTPLPIAGNDEIGQLVQAFNRLLLSRDEQRQRLFLATSGVGIGIWDYDMSAGTMTWDEQMFALYGATPGEEADAQRIWESRVHPDDLESVNQLLHSALQGESFFSAEFRIVLPDGNIRWIKANAVVLRADGDGGEPLRVIGTNWDISEQKRVELMKSQFVSTVSHELRTPLTSINGSLGLIAGGAVGELPSQARQLVDIAYKNSQRLGYLINDLLDMEKIAAGKMRFDMILQELMPIVEQAMEANEAYGRQFNVTFALVERDDSMLVRVDAQRLMQVLSNLLSNAAKFSASAERVEIAVMAQNNQVRVEVRDQGPGISPELQARLFTKFTQADSSDTRQKGGTGLGLAIAKELVERMGGTIGVHSEVGRGSVFFFELPAVHRDELCGLPPVPAVADGRPRVLVVEDDPDVAHLLATLLQHHGYHADIATTGAAAVAMVEQVPYDAMTLDLRLPDRNGISIIRQLRTHSTTAHIPIVVVAGNIEEGQLALNGGFNAIDWLQKPIDQQTLLECIHRATGGSGNKPLVLHIEDDEDTRHIISLLGQEVATFHAASTKQQARQKLEQNTYDVVILDIGLPDGSGWDLLPLIKQQNRIPQIIVLSGHELTSEQASQVDQALLKAPTSVQELIAMLNTVKQGERE